MEEKTISKVDVSGKEEAPQSENTSETKNEHSGPDSDRAKNVAGSAKQNGEKKEDKTSREEDNDSKERNESVSKDNKEKRESNLLKISRNYGDLVDFGGLMTVLRHSSEIINVHNGRIIKLEDEVERAQGTLSGVKNLNETTKRVEQLIKRTKSMIDASERGQKVESIRIQGELEEINSKIIHLSGRVTQTGALSKSNADDIIRLEKIVEIKADSEKLESLRKKVSQCASQFEVMKFEAELGKKATKADLVPICKTLEACVKLEELRSREDRMVGRFSDMLDDVRSKVLLSASKAEVDLLEKRTVLALQSASSIEAVVEQHREYFDRIFDQLETVQENLEDVPNQDTLSDIRAASEALIDNKLKEQSVETQSIQTQLEAVADNVAINTKSIENFAKGLEVNNIKFDEKVSTHDIIKFQEEIEAKYPSKEILGDVIDPIIMKMNQLVAKVVDLDEVVVHKGDAHLSNENREHIEELYSIVRAHEKFVKSNNTNTTSSHHIAGGLSDSRSSFKRPKEESMLQHSSSKVSTRIPGRKASTESVRRQSIEPLPAPTDEDMNSATRARRKSISRVENRRGSMSHNIVNAEHERRIDELTKEQTETKREIRELVAAMKEIRDMLHSQKNGSYDFSAQIATERSDIANSAGLDNAPAQPSQSKPNESPSPRKHSYTTPHDKSNWEKEDKERWLVETRMGDAARENTADMPGVED